MFIVFVYLIILEKTMIQLLLFVCVCVQVVRPDLMPPPKLESAVLRKLIQKANAATANKTETTRPPSPSTSPSRVHNRVFNLFHFVSVEQNV
jgi:hypothetical protein